MAALFMSIFVRPVQGSDIQRRASCRSGSTLFARNARTAYALSRKPQAHHQGRAESRCFRVEDNANGCGVLDDLAQSSLVAGSVG